MRLKIVLMGLLAAMPGASAIANPNVEAAIALCGSAVSGARHSILLPLVEGGAPQSLVVAPLANLAGRTDCRIVHTGFPLESIVWLGAARDAEFGPEARIALTEREEDQTILALEVDPVQPPPKRRQLVPRAEILPVDGFRPFGAEDRVSASPDIAAFEVTCRAGGKTAGAVLDIGEVPPKAALVLELQAEATKGFSAQLVRADAEATGRGLDFPATGKARLVLPKTEGAAALVITCPEGEGRLRLKRATVRSADKRPLDRPSAWVWQPEAWIRNPKPLLDSAERLGLGRLFISVPIAEGKVAEPAALAAFVTAAKDRSIAVAAVEGDPGMIFGEGRSYALARAGALAAYNSGAAPQQRLAGVQYDIEPYLGPGYAARSNVIWRLWADTLLELAGTLGQKIDAVVPYWMLETEAGAETLTQVAPVLDHVTIMAYRTNPAEIGSAAAPLLAWSANHGLGATIALELGRLATERRRVYVPGAEGELHVIRFDDVAAVVVLDRVRTGSTHRAYRLSHVVASDSSRVTFDGDLATALAVASEIAADVTAWPSARGFAFHGLDGLAADVQEKAQ